MHAGASTFNELDGSITVALERYALSGHAADAIYHWLTDLGSEHPTQASRACTDGRTAEMAACPSGGGGEAPGQLKGLRNGGQPAQQGTHSLRSGQAVARQPHHSCLLLLCIGISPQPSASSCKQPVVMGRTLHGMVVSSETFCAADSMTGSELPAMPSSLWQPMGLACFHAWLKDVPLSGCLCSAPCSCVKN